MADVKPAETKPVAKEENKTEPQETNDVLPPAVVDDDDANDDDNEQTPEKKEESIYQPPIPNRVIVARNHPLSYYVDRARRILRMEDELTVSGRANTISMACTLVEVLKRQQIAKVASVCTGMNVEPFFNSVGDPRWSQPTSMITFTLHRGEFAEYVADYHQRKVIEIFEKEDKEKSGVVDYGRLGDLNLAAKFRADDDQCEKAKKFLDDRSDQNLNLPDFIRYCSILIHPLLKDRVFKEVLKSEFEITASDNQRSPSNNNNT